MEYLKVKNWDQFQHYKDRNPPWIKLYHSLLDDYSYSCLQDDSKLLLISLYLLAAKTNNKIPNDLKWIKGKSEIRKTINLEPLLTSGFISIDSTMIAGCNQDAMLRREEKRREDSKHDSKRKFKPPSLNDVVLHCKEKGFSAELAKRAFDHYDIAGWHDAHGKKVRNWKQKINTNWLKPENKQKPNKNSSDAFAV